MNREIVEERIRKEKERREKVLEEIGRGIKKSSYYNESDEETYNKCIREKDYTLASLILSKKIDDRYLTKKIKSFEEIIEKAEDFEKLIIQDMNYWDDNDFEDIINHQCDSEIKMFSGDILITRPGNVINEEDEDKDWKLCNYGFKMENLGFKTYLTKWKANSFRDTIYNSDTKEIIGDFQANHLISVFLLDEVLKYNPNYLKQMRRRKIKPAIIKNFEGTVQITLQETHLKYDPEGQMSYIAKVIGHGKNKVTGKPLNFITA